MLTSIDDLVQLEQDDALLTLDSRLEKQSHELFALFTKYKKVGLADEGWQTSDVSRRNRLIAEIIYKQSSLLSAHLEVTPRFPTQDLEAQWDFGTKFEGKWDIPEGTGGDLKRSTWYPKRLKLKKYEVAFLYSWEQMIYDKDGFHMQHNLRVASDDMAEKIDNSGLDEYYNFSGTNMAAKHEWDDFGSPDIQATVDIAKLKSWIMKNSNLNRQEIRNLSFVYPAQCSGQLEILRDIGGIKSNFEQYFKALGISSLESRSPTLSAVSHADYGSRNSGILIAKGRETCRFYDFTGFAPVPLVQKMVLEEGHKFIIRRWWNNKVIPESKTDNNSNRIARLTGITIDP